MGNGWSPGFVNDIIVVEQRNGELLCSPVNVRLPHQSSDTNWKERNVAVSINGKSKGNFSLNELNRRNESIDGGFQFSSRCLKEMRLSPDLNHITFKYRGQNAEVKARMFLWPWDSRIVITDVDGTITRSDKRGMFFSLIGFDWTHNGVCHLFSEIQRKGYNFIYLTGRPRSMAEKTRKYLDDMKQNDESLPHGPVIVSTDGWVDACIRELVTDSQDVDFKIPVLKQIWKLFSDYHPIISAEADLFYAGFGNRSSDRRTYNEFKIQCNRIFHVKCYEGGIEVRCGEETVAKILPNGYRDLPRFLDKIFPQVQHCRAPHHSQTFARRFKGRFISLLWGSH